MTLGEHTLETRAQRALYVLCVVGFVVLIALGFGTIFHGDEWDFIAQRSFADPGSLLRPFNDQWVAVPAAMLLGNLRMLILGRGAALIWADRARAVALLAETVPDLPAYFIIQVPLPEHLRVLEAEFGKLDRDALLGVTFPRPSGDSIKYICEFFYEGDPLGSERCTSLGVEAAT